MATITEDYVSFEIAKLLREKGFDWDTYAYYEDENNPNISLRVSKTINWNKTEFISKPTHQMAMKWLREVHDLHITVHPGVSKYGFVWTYAIVFAKEAGKGETYFYKISQITTPIVKSKSYEQACEAAIKYCLENLI